MNEVSYSDTHSDAVRDLGQALASQQTAGPASTEALAQSFLVRVQRDIDEQVDRRIQQQLVGWKAPKRTAGSEKEIAVASLVVGFLVTLTKASDLGAGGIAIVWSAILLINIVWAWNPWRN